MKWTKEQSQAIDLRDNNILVAAAAGSGKTAVLVERIKKIILEEKCPVDRMLIVTFTNAAAAEMKEKIQKAIKDTLDDLIQRDGPKDQIVFLKKELNLIPSSNISTFHSFALDVIRRYFYLIHVEPNFKICDTVQETLLKGEAMDELLDELFEADEPEFYHFLKCYSGDRNENRFRELIDNCYKTIGSLPEPFQWLENSVEQLKDGKLFKDGLVAESLFLAAEEKLSEASKALKTNFSVADEYNLEGLADLCTKDEIQIESLQEACQEGDYEKLRSAIRTFKLPTLSAKYFGDYPELKDKVSANRDVIKKQVKSLKESYFSGSMEEICHEMDLTYNSAKYLQKLLLRYDELYKAKKSEKNLADFGDIEHYAYEILKDKEASEFYRNRFNHIFIDEYQDSNVIQEALIDLIKKPSNLFMVGDVKQSIYKFRLAEPEIFQNKYRLYDSGNCEDSYKIDLNKNFRSKKPVVDFINDVFEETMEGYDDKAKLYLGDPHGEECWHKPKLYLTNAPWDVDDDIEDELKAILKVQKEAMAAARIIKDHLGNPIFDSKKAIKRPLEKRDIVILMRGVRNYGDVFHKVLTENNIPAYIDDNEGFFDTIEINTFLSALYIIDNPKQDIHLLTLLRSEMLSFTIEELVQIRVEFKGESYYKAFINYAKEGNDSQIKEKCQNALEQIEQWREFSRIMPLDQLIWKLLIETGFYVAMGAMPAGSQRQANLRVLTDKARSYEKGKNSSLFGFIRYIEAIKEKKVSMGQVKMLGEKDDLVRIMTIHKSKGLEFPMVIVAGYCRRLNYSSAGKSPLIHKDLGLAFPLVDPKNRWYRTTLLQKMIKDKFHNEEVAEEKRILYVAMTRAKDILVLLGMCNDVDKDLEKVKESTPSDGSYFSMTGKTISQLGGSVEIMDDNRIISLSKGRARNIGQIIKTIEECKDSVVPEEIERMMAFEYPYEEDLLVRSKYSVSQLSNQGHKTIEKLADPDFIYEEKTISSAQRGTIYHTVLEHMNIAKAHKEGLPYVEILLKSMVEKEILTDKEAEIVEISRLERFVSSDIAARIAKSPSVHKEKRFNLLTMRDDKEVIVRGIIDCFFEEDGQIVLLDYKTGNRRDMDSGNYDAIKERYSMQMELYKEALQKATGKSVKETYLYLTDVGEFIKI